MTTTDQTTQTQTAEPAAKPITLDQLGLRKLQIAALIVMLENQPLSFWGIAHRIQWRVFTYDKLANALRRLRELDLAAADEFNNFRATERAVALSTELLAKFAAYEDQLC